MDIKQDRLTFEEYGCLIALNASLRSEDETTKVGAVAFDYNNRCIGIAYNGLKSGMRVDTLKEVIKKRNEEYLDTKSTYFIHAEQNLCALLKKGECKTICLTISPCERCCQTILALDIKRVFYLKEYHRCDKFKHIFDFYGVEYKKLPQESVNKVKLALTTLVTAL